MQEGIINPLAPYPAAFTFGAATSAYQIEGATQEGGRGASIWDEFFRRRGRIRSRDTGDGACDHFHRYPQDVALMEQIGLQAYRFSIAWPRVIPTGSGALNRKGLHFYERLVDELLSRGITPFVTLFHWDMPAALMRQYGGFLDRRAAEDFADYAEVVVRALGDRVKHWITLNEPTKHAFLGFANGAHAPGLHRPWSYLTVMHNQLLAHGMAVERIRTLCKGAKVGISVSLTPVHPSLDGSYKKNRVAAHTANDLMNFITLDPLLRGHYPEDLFRRLRDFRPRMAYDDMQRISAPLDFIGVNHYQREFARFSRWMPYLKSWVSGGGKIEESDFVGDDVHRTSMGWEVYPPAMGEALSWLRDHYGNPPVYITENGAAFEDTLTDGVVHDIQRAAFLSSHLAQVQRSIEEGSDIRGYFVWSLLDNFQWRGGYSKRFGLIHVDFETQARTIKSSGHWYSQRIRAHMAAHRLVYPHAQAPRLKRR